MQFLLNHISVILERYTGGIPLSLFLKDYYRQYPKLGSRDRKALSEAVFTYYRYAKFLPQQATPLETIAIGLNNADTDRNPFLQRIFSSLASAEQPAELIGTGSNIRLPKMSDGITQETWLQSLQVQPRLFIRVRKNLNHCLAVLEEHHVDYNVVKDDKYELAENTMCISLPNGTAVERILEAEDYVVQDWASQYSVRLILAHVNDNATKVWDVCSGAGGKSIYIKDTLKEVSLLSTDIRKTILYNLAARFKQYKLKKPEILILDGTNLAVMAQLLQNRKFDLIICDVPCSGSGTWARTPEAFHFFDRTNLVKFKNLQQPIAKNAQDYLTEGGLFAYITCSVFQEENEDVVAELLKSTTLQLISQQVINGIEHKADSMFCALLKKP